MAKHLKDFNQMLFGLKIYNYTTKEVGLLIYTWTNVFADEEVPYATCVDKNGKKYCTEMDNIIPLETLNEDELKEFNITDGMI